MLGSPLQRKRRRRSWGLGLGSWPTKYSGAVASVCWTVGSLAAFQLPALPCPALPICISLAWPHPAAPTRRERLLLNYTRSHLIPPHPTPPHLIFQEPASHSHSHSHSQSPLSFHFLSTHTAFINLLLLLHCLCVYPSSNLHACLPACLLAYLLSFHYSFKVRSRSKHHHKWVGEWRGVHCLQNWCIWSGHKNHRPAVCSC